MLKYIWVAALVLALDQITKHLATAGLQPYEPVMLLPYLNATLMFNTGAAFSFLAGASGWQRWFFAAIAIVVSVVIVIWLKRLPRTERWLAVALALILGGALGNVWDRILLGHVVDFIDVYYQAGQCLPFFVQVFEPASRCHWPAFNIADSAICAGAVMLLMDGLIFKRHKN
ncbi:MAG: signal peptidase II [Gammaproteobacteria bacterium RBG_16_57_12]|nr:MAG: signal peptidase II [Gammaproteobacteria bacterium RBG_16_57_12]